MAKAVKKESLPEKIDRLGELQHKLEDLRLAFQDKITDLLTEEKILSEDIANAVAERIPLAKQTAISKEEAGTLEQAVAALSMDLMTPSSVYRLPVSVRNNKIMDPVAVRKALGQKRFNELAQVSVTDLGKVLGKEEIDKVTVAFKPSLIVGKPTAR